MLLSLSIRIDICTHTDIYFELLHICDSYSYNILLGLEFFFFPKHFRLLNLKLASLSLTWSPPPIQFCKFNFNVIIDEFYCITTTVCGNHQWTLFERNRHSYTTIFLIQNFHWYIELSAIFGLVHY